MDWCFSPFFSSPFSDRISFSGVASSMTEYTGFSATKLGLMSTGYMFAYAIGQFICGRFADQVRPKRALIWGMLLGK